MGTIKQTYQIRAPLNKVWEAIINPKLIKEWSGEPAKMSASAGDRFELWGGGIYGTNKEVIKEKKLVQDWYSGNWKNASQVTLNFEEKNKQTIIELIHENVPNQDFDIINSGWKKYYLGKIKKLLEN